MSALSMTPAQAAQAQQAISVVIAALNAALTTTPVPYTRAQLSQARLAVSYYTTLSAQVASLVTSRTSTQYLVQPGDTLQTLAQTYLGDARQYKAIMQANGILDQNIAVGQSLVMPPTTTTVSSSLTLNG